jgi:hypothetical protein
MRRTTMKLKEFNFNTIMTRGLCIKEENAFATDIGKSFEGFIGEVLRKIPIEWAEREIVDTRYFFDIFVIELKED